MNIEAYDAESLRRLVRPLQQENSALKEKLNRILMIWHVDSFLCFGDARMFLLKEEKTEDTFHNVKTGGIAIYAQNKEEKKHFAMNVKM